MPETHKPNIGKLYTKPSIVRSWLICRQIMKLLSWYESQHKIPKEKYILSAAEFHQGHSDTIIFVYTYAFKLN